MINTILRIVAIATYKRKPIKHNIIVALILIYSPVLSSILGVLYKLSAVKLSMFSFLIIGLLVNVVLAFAIYLNFSGIQRRIEDVKGIIPNKTKDINVLKMIIMIIVSGVIGLFISIYAASL
jgi:hypothetical protein